MTNKYSFTYDKDGKEYECPNGLDKDEFFIILDELLAFCKIKGLTVTQAQLLFKTCEEYVSDFTLI